MHIHSKKGLISHQKQPPLTKITSPPSRTSVQVDFLFELAEKILYLNVLVLLSINTETDLRWFEFNNVVQMFVSCLRRKHEALHEAPLSAWLRWGQDGGAPITAEAAGTASWTPPAVSPGLLLCACRERKHNTRGATLTHMNNQKLKVAVFSRNKGWTGIIHQSNSAPCDHVRCHGVTGRETATRSMTGHTLRDNKHVLG